MRFSGRLSPLRVRVTALASMFVVTLGVVVGCGDAGPHLVAVRGRVTWQGQPVTVGQISFIPTRGGQPAIGQFTDDGTYQLRSHAGRDGIEPGEYQVVVQAYEGSFIENNVRYVVPEKYAHVDTSGLRETIPTDPAGDVEFNYALTE